MNPTLKLAVFAIFMVLLTIAIVRSVIRRSQLDRTYSSAIDSLPLYEFKVHVKKKAWGGYGYVALKSPAGTRLRIYPDLIRIDLAEALEGRLLGGRMAMPTPGMHMKLGRAAFPIRMKQCIVLQGIELGHNIDLAVYSEDGLSEIWAALKQVGVGLD